MKKQIRDTSSAKIVDELVDMVAMAIAEKFIQQGMTFEQDETDKITVGNFVYHLKGNEEFKTRVQVLRDREQRSQQWDWLNTRHHRDTILLDFYKTTLERHLVENSKVSSCNECGQDFVTPLDY